ncbi:MAG: hypothetical protein ABIJ96_08325 [Elusimicrobiota bacterium]
MTARDFGTGGVEGFVIPDWEEILIRTRIEPDSSVRDGAGLPQLLKRVADLAKRELLTCQEFTTTYTGFSSEKRFVIDGLPPYGPNRADAVFEVHRILERLGPEVVFVVDIVRCSDRVLGTQHRLVVAGRAARRRECSISMTIARGPGGGWKFVGGKEVRDSERGHHVHIPSLFWEATP